MFIIETVNFFISTINMCWNALGRVYIPTTSINLQFIFIFSLVGTLGYKILQSKLMPPVKVDNAEIPNDYYTKKKKEKFDNISNNRKYKKIKTNYLYWRGD